MKNKEKIIGFDFQGWPIRKMTIREILSHLGAVNVDGRIGFEDCDPILDIYPITLTDDGMAYGVDPEWIVSTDYDSFKNSVIMWREPTHKDVEEKIAEIEEEEKKWKF